jgi:hypothetical protein
MINRLDPIIELARTLVDIEVTRLDNEIKALKGDLKTDPNTPVKQYFKKELKRLKKIVTALKKYLKDSDYGS